MRTLRILAGGLLLTLSLARPGLAAEGQSKEQQACINFLNKGYAKVSSTEFKEIAKCWKDYTSGKVTVDACAEGATVVFAAQEKVILGQPAKCSTPPTIGPTDAGSVTSTAIETTYSLATALLGSSLSDLVKCSDAPVNDGCKCQNTVIKTTAKLFDFYLKSFNKCKKSGLKATGADQIVDSAGLLACLMDPIKLDPKAKLPKLIAKAKSTIAKGCSALVTNPLPQSYECVNKTGDPLATCVDARTRCAACSSLNSADYLGSYSLCDIFDDSVVNGSCGGA